MTLVESSMSISEAAERTGLTTHTLRYYEREGLMIGGVGRASSTHRRYTDADLVWIDFLTKLRSTAMPISKVREYVALVRLGDRSMSARLALLQEHRLAVLAQLDEINNSLRGIEHKIAIYSKEIN